MNDKELLKLLGINDTTITLTADDECLQLMLEKKIDNYLKNLMKKKRKKNKLIFIKKNMKILKKRKDILICLKILMYMGKLKTP